MNKYEGLALLSRGADTMRGLGYDLRALDDCIESLAQAIEDEFVPKCHCGTSIPDDLLQQQRHIAQPPKCQECLRRDDWTFMEGERAAIHELNPLPQSMWNLVHLPMFRLGWHRARPRFAFRDQYGPRIPDPTRRGGHCDLRRPHAQGFSDLQGA